MKSDDDVAPQGGPRAILAYTVATATWQGSVTSAPYQTRLEDAVNGLIREGWEPFGGLVTFGDGDALVLVQPMVRRA